MTRFKDIGVVGGGAWGTALAATAQRAGARVTLWAREADVVASIAERHENVSFLPSVTLHPSIAATGDLGRVARADALLLVVPAQYVRTTAQALAAVLPDSTPIVIAAKGIEMGSGATMGEV
ncbi:MAG TPA: 2-dehydropantoate 2-reductase N-terminal domain-containing protein, partial [Aliidongia sp.]|uniref:2-dehydropantoate 2-reductase N-terminal domain-containing protein n=1 Tax=Aliidongia sp. TaxID=1914230 RepID=UPI002DDD4ACB